MTRKSEKTKDDEKGATRARVHRLVMRDLQSEVAAWAASVFGNSSAKSKILHLWEELDEAFLESSTKAQRFEIADCGLIVMHLASSLSVELPDPSIFFAAMMRDKFEICKQRKWGAPDSNGVVRHVSA